MDVGSLIFLQGRYVDWRMAMTITNLGDSTLSGSEVDDIVLKQYRSVGASITLHNEVDAIQFSYDLRDSENVFEEDRYKHVYYGTKVLIRRILGLAAGMYQGAPTYGLELDLWLLRLSAATFFKEYDEVPGIDSRQIYSLTLRVGFDF